MPQELALGPSFSIMESLKYYGWIAGLQNAEITQRTNVLAKLLVLPDLTSKIIYLSGGQQRRVSLACALIHQPQLLILDEPTVGLDSILRQEIWDYLQQLSKKMVTIIITTHYIEETRQADMVGFMRGGNILTEDSPDNVLRRFNEPTLEKVYHKSEKSALDSVSSGKTYATIIIKPDYSKALHNRINKWYFTSSSEIEQSEISVIRDNTNAEVSEYITLYLYKNFQAFLQNYLESCNLKKKFFAYPVKVSFILCLWV
ncbi:hypothetical protein FQR65_LT17799 [Abscondita terminalis]|nr:hypothetical protein FQR65_LT17799 [Abscondita terminalis]